MKYAYPDSLITMAAALTQACSIHKHNDEIDERPAKTGASTIHQLTIDNTTIGIKFDTMSSRKYFVLIYTTQQKVFVNKTMEKYDHLMLSIPAESGIKTKTETC